MRHGQRSDYNFSGFHEDNQEIHHKNIGNEDGGQFQSRIVRLQGRMRPEDLEVGDGGGVIINTVESINIHLVGDLSSSSRVECTEIGHVGR